MPTPSPSDRSAPAELPVPAALADLGIDRIGAWSIPMTTRFRRITVRDGLLLHGPAGWAEASPFWDYGSEESSAWLRAAIEDATCERPAPRRETVAASMPYGDRAVEHPVAPGRCRIGRSLSVSGPDSDDDRPIRAATPARARVCGRPAPPSAALRRPRCPSRSTPHRPHRNRPHRNRPHRNRPHRPPPPEPPTRREPPAPHPLA